MVDMHSSVTRMRNEPKAEETALEKEEEAQNAVATARNRRMIALILRHALIFMLFYSAPAPARAPAAAFSFYTPLPLLHSASLLFVLLSTLRSSHF